MIYLDNNATTRLAPEALAAMRPWLEEAYGNPSAGYRFGREARRAVDRAREQVAALLGAHPEEIVFTSGGTESNNLALHSALSLRPDHRAILTSTVEHSAIEEPVKFQESSGYEARWTPVDSLGRLDLEAWQAHLEKGGVALATLMWANNETGVLSPIAEAATLAANHDVYFHSDAVQAAGKVPLRVHELPIHTLSVSAHKLHGPKGIGALWVNRRSRFQPQILGGGRSRGAARARKTWPASSASAPRRNWPCIGLRPLGLSPPGAIASSAAFSRRFRMRPSTGTLRADCRTRAISTSREWTGKAS